MSGLFSELSSLGLSNLSGVKLFDDEEKNQELKNEEKKSEAPQINEEDFLFEKTVKCPVCDKKFKTITVKTGKPRLVGSDSDLRPKYLGIDPIKYDVIVCQNCGYATMTRYFTALTAFQIKQITENVSANYKGTESTSVVLSYDEAITRYKLALLNTVVKKAKMSERAYTCLKIAWLYRGKAETLDSSDPEYAKVLKECRANEADFISNAYEGFVVSLGKEVFPICGMDETTLNYLMADLAHKCGKDDDSMKLIARILTSTAANAKIKDKARELKDSIKKK